VAKVLYVRANPKPVQQSFTLRLAQAFLSAYREKNPADTITELDLYKTDIPLINETVMSAWVKLSQGTSLSTEELSTLERINSFTMQFIESDKVVIAAPMWNFSFPPKVKAYIDTIMIAGKTFKYTENGAVGLLKDKSVLLIEARGGIYSDDPTKALEHAESYLKAIMNFMGIQSFKTIICEGVSSYPQRAEELFNNASQRAVEIAGSF